MEARTLQQYILASEYWREHGWQFRLYTGPLSIETKATSGALTDITKQIIRSRVISIIDPSEITGHGFAISSELEDGTARIQIWWWTIAHGLHREAVQRTQGANSWERFPPWEIGDARDIAILAHEINKFRRLSRN